MPAEEPGAESGTEPIQPAPGLVPKDFLRAIAVWSLIPSYMVAGGVIGYFLDRWLGLFPYLTGLGLVLALVMATRDMLRLRDMM